MAPMEPPIGYGSAHRSIFPESHLERYRVGFQAVALMGLYENWVLPAYSTSRWATRSWIPIAEARSLRHGVWFSKSASVPG